MLHHKLEDNKLRRPLSQNDLNTSIEMNNNCNFQQDNNLKNYILYDEHQVKCFTSKRTCVLTSHSQQHAPQQQKVSQASLNRHLLLQKQHHQNHQRQLKEFDEETEILHPSAETLQQSKKTNEQEIKISYACILIGYSSDLDFLPPCIVNELAVDPAKILNTKENPISIHEFTHETSKFKNLYAMGPLVGDNFVRFGTGGALAITSSIWKSRQKVAGASMGVGAPNVGGLVN